MPVLAAICASRGSIDVWLDFKGRCGDCGQLEITINRDGTWSISTEKLTCQHCRKRFEEFAAARATA